MFGEREPERWWFSRSVPTKLYTEVDAVLRARLASRSGEERSDWKVLETRDGYWNISF